LRRQLQSYIDQLNSVPRSISTNFQLAIQQARITAGTQSGMGSGRVPQERAQGGIVNATRPYIVGEEGPELFIPGQSGMILPNTALIDAMAQKVTAPGGAGGATVVVNVQGSVTTERDLVEAIRRGLVDSQRSGAQLVYRNV